MVDDTAWWYFFILSCVIVLRAIAPLSIAYTGYLLVWRPVLHRLLWPVQIWAIAESAFYAVFYVYRHRYLQHPATHPELLPRDKREKLVRQCVENITDFEEYLSNWFLGAPIRDIKRDNLKDFLCWAFLNTDSAEAIHEEELDLYTALFEDATGTQFAPGRSAVKCQRLSIDKTAILHRSLWWYLCVGFVDALSWVYLMLHGFRFHHASFRLAFRRLPIRPWTLFMARSSPAKNLTYWSRPHRSTKRLPILFIHGIGVGLYPYLTFLSELNSKNDLEGEVGVLALEMPHISSTLGPAALDKDIFCKQLVEILDKHDYRQFVLVSHSFGTFVSTQLLQDPTIASRIVSIIMVDPVSILLHLPDVANNFMLRKPRSANQWQLWYFASKDAGVAHTLSRRFFWSENILWKEDLHQYRVTIYLSERDLLVNTARIHDYLLSEQASTGKDDISRSSSAELNVIRCPNMDHGQLFDSKIWRTRLLDEVHRHSAMLDRKQI